MNSGLKTLFANFLACATGHSAAAGKYTPSNIAQSSCGATVGQQNASTGSGSNNLQNPDHKINQVTGSGAYTAATQQIVSTMTPRILFGVKGPDAALKLEQIEIKDNMNDSMFYKSLRTCYRLNRGRFRYWFSFWRLGNCEVVKARHILSPKDSQSLTQNIVVPNLHRELCYQGT